MGTAVLGIILVCAVIIGDGNAFVLLYTNFNPLATPSERYDGNVYNFQVSGEDKSYLVKGFAVHNCASAIASTSMMSVMVTENGGMELEEAKKFKPSLVFPNEVDNTLT